MQEKVLNYLKSHFQGIATAILVLIAIFIGYAWGMSGFTGDINDGDIAIEEVVATSTAPIATTTTPVTRTPTTPSAPVKKYVVKVKAKEVTIASTTIVSSEHIRPIPEQPKAVSPLYFFYGAGSVDAPAPVQQNND